MLNATHRELISGGLMAGAARQVIFKPGFNSSDIEETQRRLIQAEVLKLILHVAAGSCFAVSFPQNLPSPTSDPLPRKVADYDER
jgi:hypothetical protein